MGERVMFGKKGSHLEGWEEGVSFVDEWQPRGVQLKADGGKARVQGISAEATTRRLKHGTSRACQERLTFTHVGEGYL